MTPREVRHRIPPIVRLQLSVVGLALVLMSAASCAANPLPEAQVTGEAVIDSAPPDSDAPLPAPAQSDDDILVASDDGEQIADPAVEPDVEQIADLAVEPDVEQTADRPIEPDGEQAADRPVEDEVADVDESSPGTGTESPPTESGTENGEGPRGVPGEEPDPAIALLVEIKGRIWEVETTLIGTDNGCDQDLGWGEKTYGLNLSASDGGWVVGTPHGSLLPTGDGGATAESQFRGGTVNDEPVGVTSQWTQISFDDALLNGVLILDDLRDDCRQTDEVSLLLPDDLHEFFSQLPLHGSCGDVAAEVTASSTPGTATRVDPLTDESATGEHLILIEVVDSGLPPGTKVEVWYSVSGETHETGFWHGVVQPDGTVRMEVPVDATGFTFVRVADLASGCTVGSAQFELSPPP